MNIEQLQHEKEQIEARLNNIIENDLARLMNKYKGLDINIYFDYDTKETMDGTKYLNGKTKIRVEL